MSGLVAGAPLPSDDVSGQRSAERSPHGPYQCGTLGVQPTGIPFGYRMDLANDTSSTVAITANARDGSSVPITLQKASAIGSHASFDGRAFATVTSAAATSIRFAIVPRDAPPTWS